MRGRIKSGEYNISFFSQKYTNLIFQQASLKLAAKEHPKVISAWLRSKENPGDATPPFAVADLAKVLRQWWLLLMPEWRLAGKSIEADDAWPPSRTIPGGEDWCKVRKVGAQGIVLILFGLALWRSASVAGDSSRREYASVLEDVAWVMNEMVKDMVPFVQRNRPTRSPKPPTVNGNETRRTSSHQSIPSKRKLGLSDLKAPAPRKTKHCDTA